MIVFNLNNISPLKNNYPYKELKYSFKKKITNLKKTISRYLFTSITILFYLFSAPYISTVTHNNTTIIYRVWLLSTPLLCKWKTSKSNTAIRPKNWFSLMSTIYSIHNQFIKKIHTIFIYTYVAQVGFTTIKAVWHFKLRHSSESFWIYFIPPEQLGTSTISGRR